MSETYEMKDLFKQTKKSGFFECEYCALNHGRCVDGDCRDCGIAESERICNSLVPFVDLVQNLTEALWAFVECFKGLEEVEIVEG